MLKQRAPEKEGRGGEGLRAGGRLERQKGTDQEGTVCQGKESRLCPR